MSKFNNLIFKFKYLFFSTKSIYSISTIIVLNIMLFAFNIHLNIFIYMLSMFSFGAGVYLIMPDENIQKIEIPSFENIKDRKLFLEQINVLLLEYKDSFPENMQYFKIFEKINLIIHEKTEINFDNYIEIRKVVNYMNDTLEQYQNLPNFIKENSKNEFQERFNLIEKEMNKTMESINEIEVKKLKSYNEFLENKSSKI